MAVMGAHCERAGIIDRMRLLILAVLGLTACSPALDWRETRPEDSGAVALFPCKPTSHARKVRLAGGEVLLTLHACTAADVTWALATADVVDPARVGPALEALLRSAADNIGARDPRPQPLTVAGATPNPGAGRVALEGRRSDGQVVQEQVAVFAKGTRVFQATVIGAMLPAEGVETFFGGLRTPS
jgi:hypothetical protein